jgi:hypothetical protein
VFSKLHEVFFCEFMRLLQEWLLRLKENHTMNKRRHLEWNPVEIVQLQQVNNKFMHIVDYCLDRIIAWFIIEFAVYTAKSYNTIEKDFLQGP